VWYVVPVASRMSMLYSLPKHLENEYLWTNASGIVIWHATST
jgi:hypothetical protein